MENKELIELILANDNPKRLLAFVQEAFLSKKILPSIQTEGVSEGWVKGSLRNGPDKSFKLFQIVEREQSISDTDVIVAKKLSEMWNLDAVQLNGTLTKLSGEYKLLIRAINYADGQCLFRDEPARTVSLHVDPYRPRFTDRELTKGECDEIKKVETFLHEWPAEELRKLLFTRFVMNQFLRMPVDLDAVYLRTREQSPYILEYKRKDAMKGFYPFTNGVRLSVPEVNDLQTSFRNRLKSIGFGEKNKPSMQEVRDHFAQYVSENFQGSIGKRVWERAFGLDLSHASNVPQKNEPWGYSYLIWEAPAPKDISSLLDVGLVPKFTPPLIFNDLCQDSFSGIAFTVNRDSGSFDDRTRLQMCVRKTGAGFRNAEKLRSAFAAAPDSPGNSC